MEKRKRAAARSRSHALEEEPVNGNEDLIFWEEAEWTRQALGMSNADFAQMLGVKPAIVYQGQKRPQGILKPQQAVLLRFGVNRRRHRLSS